MPELLPDFVSVLVALNAARVRFVLIGGLAMVAHGSAHITEDIDICYARDRENLVALVAALTPSNPHLRGAPEGLPFLFDTRTLANAFNLTLATDIGSVDLLGEVPGVGSFDTLWGRSVTLEMGGVLVRVASVDDLIAMKEAAGRLKDQSHVLELRALRKLTAGDDSGAIECEIR